MANNAQLREVVQKAVDDSGAEEVGRQIGVSGEQVRQYLANPDRQMRVKEASKYHAWMRNSGQQLSQGWEPAVFLAGYAEAILGMMEDAARRQRVLVERIRALSPESSGQAMPEVRDPSGQAKRHIPENLVPKPGVLKNVIATHEASADAAKARQEKRSQSVPKKSAGNSR